MSAELESGCAGTWQLFESRPHFVRHRKHVQVSPQFSAMGRTNLFAVDPMNHLSILQFSFLVESARHGGEM